MIIVCQNLLKKSKIRAMAVFPFILMRNIKDKKNIRLIQHERIHLRQQLELLIIPFYMWYFLEYFMHWLKLKDAYLAYRAISFEREAYDNEAVENYIETRPLYSFLRYL